MDNFNEETLGLIIVFGGFIAVFFIIWLVFYLIDAIARYRYLKVRSYENAWMAFIPIVNIWASVEATYGDPEKINIYGWNAPAIVMKLWPVVCYILSMLINFLPIAGSILSLILSVLNIIVLIMLFKDMMERLDNPQDGFMAVIAVIIPVISSAVIIDGTRKFNDGDQNWKEDSRVLKSQTETNGPLSFMNGSH